MIDADLKAYLDVRFDAVDIRFESHEREHELERQADVAARDTLSHRLDGMNEVRAQLKDQADTLARQDSVDALSQQISTLASRESVEHQDQAITSVRTTQAWIIGVGAGLVFMSGLMVAGVAALGGF